MRTALTILLATAALGATACDDSPPAEDCRTIGNRPPCCEYFGNRDYGGFCEEGIGSGGGPDAYSPSLDAGVASDAGP